MTADQPSGRLTAAQKQALLKRIIEARKAEGTARDGDGTAAAHDRVPESYYRIEKFPQYYQLHLQRALAERAGLRSPYFLVHEGVARDTSTIAGREVLNFATYNYLGLNGDPRVTAAAQAAAERFGTSASASRLVSGERPPHRDLERALADLHGAEDAIAFVSGFGTNVTVIGSLVGQKDLVLLDRLIHNSIIQGAKLSGATLQTFAHNDWQSVDTLLAASRRRYERVLIVVEGVYSMDGDVCPLDRFVELRERHRALLMVDEAHSMGLLGSTGRGIGEHFGLPSSAVDVWMGTLSKTFAACGGYVAGCAALIELLKFTSPGFVYSVGMPPPVAAAALAAIKAMLAEPERVTRLRENGRCFFELARSHGLAMGHAEGGNIIPIIIGRSVLAAKLSNALFDRGINVQPIIYPAVEEKLARLRFFLSASHSAEQIRFAVSVLVEELKRLLAEAEELADPAES